MSARLAQRGITLPELLIALMIFAMISSTAIYALRLSVEGREQLETIDGAIREMQLARLQIKEDLVHAIERAPRDEFGGAAPAPFLGGQALRVLRPIEGEEKLLSFVRQGWSNPDARAPRSDLQAVEYILIGDDFVRRVRPYVDDARGQPRSDRVLLHDVSFAEIEFAANATPDGVRWDPQWPAPQGQGVFPLAIRLDIGTARFGQIEQMFWLGRRS
ncbi:MAG: type II secretion system minor pseudopilin GspJ [Parvularculaceae bacterium]